MTVYLRAIEDIGQSLRPSVDRVDELEWNAERAQPLGHVLAPGLGVLKRDHVYRNTSGRALGPHGTQPSRGATSSQEALGPTAGCRAHIGTPRYKKPRPPLRSNFP